jgi:hypothetical protein
MEAAMRRHALDICLKLALLLVCLCCPLAAKAQQITVGRGLVCDTAEQVSDFVASQDDAQTTLTRINTEAKTNVCGIVQVAFIRGDPVAKVRTKQGPAEVVAIIVVGFFNGQGWLTMSPYPQYSLFMIPGQEV